MTATQPDNQTIECGDHVRVIGNAEGTVWETGLTWKQRKLFHTLVNDGMIEMNAYTACLSVE